MNKEELYQITNEFIMKEFLDKDIFIVDIEITNQKEIQITLDAFKKFGIDECVAVSKHISSTFAEQLDDYDLTVSSAGLTSGLRIPRQYEKYRSKDLDITTKKGQKITATVKDVSDEEITCIETKKTKSAETGKKEDMQITHTLRYSEIKKAVPQISFSKNNNQ